MTSSKYLIYPFNTSVSTSILSIWPSSILSLNSDRLNLLIYPMTMSSFCLTVNFLPSMSFYLPSGYRYLKIIALLTLLFWVVLALLTSATSRQYRLNELSSDIILLSNFAINTLNSSFVYWSPTNCYIISLNDTISILL